MLTRHYAKVCDVPDFEDPELASAMDDVAPHHAPGIRHRKRWEFAMGALFLAEVGRLDGTASILDVGAGSEEIVFWLANRAERVTAIDIYGRGDFGEREADRSMLEHPAAHAPYEYPEERLEVRDMDARRLDFPDASFDAVVSFSSIEHFGSREDIASAAREIGRVLKPGGHAFIVTEVFVEQHPVDHAPVLFAIRVLTAGRRCGAASPWDRGIGDVFTERELHKRVIGPSGLTLMQPLRTDISPEALANVHTVTAQGSSAPSPDPHIVVAADRSRFTSVCLPLVKT